MQKELCLFQLSGSHIRNEGLANFSLEKCAQIGFGDADGLCHRSKLDWLVDVIVNIAKRLFQNIRMFAFVRNKKRIEEYVRKLQKHSLCHLQAVEPDDILIMVIVSIEIYGFD